MPAVNLSLKIRRHANHGKTTVQTYVSAKDSPETN